MDFQRLAGYFARWTPSDAGPALALLFGDGGAYGTFGRLRLSSAFQPLLDAHSSQVLAYEGLLRAVDPQRRSIAPDRLFAALAESRKVVVLDRLCRVIHAINFVHQAPAGVSLFLNVNARHLTSIASGEHGAAFETLLGWCGLKPQQVVLELLESGVDDLARLQDAIAAYRAKGFRIAIDDFGSRHSNFDRLWALTPDIVKLDRSLLVQAGANPRAARVLPGLIRLLHELGAEVVCEGIESAGQHRLAIDSGADLLQGYYYAWPHAQLPRPTLAAEPHHAPPTALAAAY